MSILFQSHCPVGQNHTYAVVFVHSPSFKHLKYIVSGDTPQIISLVSKDNIFVYVLHRCG